MPTESDERTATASSVLIVEDDEAQLEFLDTLLHRFGYEPVLARTLAEGHSHFERDRFACALVDLGLPDGNGRDLIAYFREQDPTLVCIVLTGDSSAETVIGTMRAGAFDYLTKPIESATLQAALNRAMAHHAVILERAELFRLLYEEREQLRARVDAATRDIRQYAAACETSNARLRALLRFSQASGTCASEEGLFRELYKELREHMPVQAILLRHPPTKRLMTLYTDDHKNDGNLRFYGSASMLDATPIDPIELQATPDAALGDWAKRHLGIDLAGMVPVVFHQEFWNRPASTVAFFLAGDFQPDSSDREFLDMCAYLLAFEWERGRLLLHVAHQASLGNIAVELVRNFAQPLTAIRTAADFLREEAEGTDGIEGVRIIQENVERLRNEAQEFRKLSTLRQDSVETVCLEQYVDHALEILAVAIQNRNITVRKEVTSPCECVLLNGTALARTFLDLILGALRAADVGGTVDVCLRERDQEHVVFELRHNGGQKRFFVDSMESVVASAAPSESDSLGLQLAERTVHSCGGTVSVDYDEAGCGTLRITLPSNATKMVARQETAS